MKLLIFLLFSMLATAHAEVMKRDVLALWDKEAYRDLKDSSATNIHNFLEVVLNYYGYKVTYHEISNPLPETKSYAGIVTWFNRNAIKDPRMYSRWIQEQVRSGTRLLVLGETGIAAPAGDLSLLNETFSTLGWEFTERFFDNPVLLQVKGSPDKTLVEFERSYEGEVPTYRQVRNRKKENKTWLTLTSGKSETDSDVIITGPRGAYVQGGAAIFRNPHNQRDYWRINPFRLIETVFPVTVPIPDVTTINGLRIFFSHIDGDGIQNVSYTDRKRFSSVVIRDEILKKYPYPVTVSVITAELDPEFKVVNDRKFFDIAESIFRLPNVEPSSHTRYHPLIWDKIPAGWERESYQGKNSKKTGPLISWNPGKKELDLEMETAGSLRWISEKFPGLKGKPQLLQWSGNTRPPREALSALESAGYLNLNGGDSRFDSLFNSITNLSSLYRTVDGFTQVYSGNANENIYTNLWSPPFAGFRDVVETFERTETPQRLKPVNVYYHFYSGDYDASLSAVKAALDWSMQRELYPIFASDYARIVKGFISTKIEKITENSFQISDTGSLRTLRMKNTGQVPQYRLSENVIGHVEKNGELYIHLGDRTTTKLVLGVPEKNASYVVTSNARVLNGKLEGHVPVKAVIRINGKAERLSSPSHMLILPGGFK